MQNEIACIEVAKYDDAEVIPMLVTFHSEDGNYKIYTRKQAEEFLADLQRMCDGLAEGIKTLEFLPETKDGGEEDES